MDTFREDMVSLLSVVHPLRSMADEIRAALDGSDQFMMRYQPIIDAKSRKVELAKASLRWTSPVLGEVLPGRFIHIAEQNGLIRRITRMVLRKVSEDLSKHRNLVVSLNVSRLDITDLQFPSEVANILSEYGVSPARVILECTDSVTPEEISKASVTLRELRQQGHAVAIYEMETGFTSFGFLEMPGFTLLKISKVLLDEALENATSRQNLQGAIDDSRAKGIKSLAFGVETEALAELVEEMGFDFQQGFFHSPPLSLIDLMMFSGQSSGRYIAADA
jgi:EAL domain-containing protein (putative c-di-GMP-specific phosphodiesterase class I)